MAAIVDPAAVSFANTKIRVIADAMAQLYFTAKSIVDEWNATSMSAKITNTADLIVDGSAQDGRNQITGIQATAIITEAMAVITHYEASTNAVLNQVTSVKVNGQARF